MAASFGFCEHFGYILGVLGASWNVLGSIFKGFGKRWGRFWKLWKLIFRWFFGTFAIGLHIRFDPYRTLAGAVEIKPDKVRALTRCSKIDRRSNPSAFRTRVPAKNALKMCHGACQGRFWKVLEASWACLGRFLGALDRLWVALGCFVAAPGYLLVASWPLLGASWSHLGALGCSQA